ncbi:MAG: hypothetical protein KIS92_14585 [Planctomycetota bacterium]|nr:hypothetical protein [Planctomycetota bacterium]
MERSIEVVVLLLFCIWVLQRECMAHSEEKLSLKPVVRAAEPAAPEIKGANGPGLFTAKLPEFKIKDPHGKELTGAELSRDHGMVLMLTVPNLSQYEKQMRWQRLLKKELWPKENPPTRVVLQDLSQQETFKDKARSMMQEKYKPEPGGLVVLVDETGEVRRKFNVCQNETVILVFDARGRLVHHEADDVTPDPESARRVLKVVKGLTEAAAPTPAPVQPTGGGTIFAAAHK